MRISFGKLGRTSLVGVRPLRWNDLPKKEKPTRKQYDKPKLEPLPKKETLSPIQYDNVKLEPRPKISYNDELYQKILNCVKLQTGKFSNMSISTCLGMNCQTVDKYLAHMERQGIIYKATFTAKKIYELKK